MERRTFVKALTLGLVVRPGGGLAANQANPTVNFFGMTIVRANNRRILGIVMPAVDGHATFMAAPQSVITQLGGTPVTSVGSGLSQAHVDLAGPLWMWCLEGKAVKIGNGSCDLQPALEARLPHLSTIAGKMVPGTTFALGPVPMTSVAVELGDGLLRNHGTPSRNAGTHAGVRWRFYDNGMQLTEDMNLTDLAVFESTTSSVDVTVDSKTIQLTAGTPVWLINVPLLTLTDDTPQVIEHASEVFSTLAPTLNTSNMAVTTADNVAREERGGPLAHPCAKMPGLLAKAKQGADHRLGMLKQQNRGKSKTVTEYFPPDVDPCFMARV